jgi:hypothetical protein
MDVTLLIDYQPAANFEEEARNDPPTFARL